MDKKKVTQVHKTLHDTQITIFNLRDPKAWNRKVQGKPNTQKKMRSKMRNIK